MNLNLKTETQLQRITATAAGLWILWLLIYAVLPEESPGLGLLAALFCVSAIAATFMAIAIWIDRGKE